LAGRLAARSSADCPVTRGAKAAKPRSNIADALAARGVPFDFVTGYDKDRMLEGYRTFPVLQKPFHRAELTDLLAKLLTPQKSGVEPAIAAVAKTSP
jgi:hypothetical protein